jgi:DNA polymerase III delta prime subunit
MTPEEFEALSSARANVELIMKTPSYETVAIPSIDFSPVPFTKTNGKAEVKKCKRGKFIDYDCVRMTVLEWLDKNRIPLGKVTLFSGPPGIGKTSVADELIARLTSGLLSDIPGRALVLAEEDSLSDTKLPRLAAMGANLHLIKGLTMAIVNDGSSEYERDLALGSDLDLIREYLTEKRDVRLVVIDPFSNYMGEANMNKEQDCRKLLMPLVRLAEEFNVAILLIGHFNKNREGDAITRQGGATALTGVPRVVWNFTKDADNETECLMASPKNPHLKSQRYRIIERDYALPDGKTTKVNVVEWLGETAKSAETNLQELNDKDRNKVRDAEQWLRENLREEELATTLIQKCKSAALCSEFTVKRAAERLKKSGLKKENRRGDWYWWWEPSPNIQ